jgi:hypothetical protein
MEEVDLLFKLVQEGFSFRFPVDFAVDELFLKVQLLFGMHII